MIILNAPAITVTNGKARVTCTVQEGEKTQPLWFEVDAINKDILPQDRLDAFVVAALLPAMLISLSK